MIIKHCCKECGLKANGFEEISNNFYKDISYRIGFKLKCKVCYKKQCIKYNKEHRGVARKASRKYKARIEYNITLEEYESALNTSNCCEVCGSTLKLCYDHDHKTGKFRGILCSNCNLAEGNLKGDISIAYNMYKYIDKHNK